jgi:hypothetical protein
MQLCVVTPTANIPALYKQHRHNKPNHLIFPANSFQPENSIGSYRTAGIPFILHQLKEEQ